MRKLVFLAVPGILIAAAVGVGFIQQQQVQAQQSDQVSQTTVAPQPDQPQLVEPAKDQEAAAAQTMPEPVIVTGKIEDVAQDGTYIVVNGQKIATIKDMVEEAYFEKDDTVEITAEKENGQLKAVSYRYLFDDENEVKDQADPAQESVPADSLEADPSVQP